MGAGANLWFLAREGAYVCGVDISETAVTLARKKLDLEVPDWFGDDSPESLLLACSATRLPFPNCEFDLIIDVECLAHLDWDDARLAIQEAYRVALPGAQMFCRMLDSDNELICDSVGSAGLLKVTSGILHGMPPVRLLARSDVDLLLEPWEVVAVERETYTTNSGAAQISEYVIWASKDS